MICIFRKKGSGITPGTVQEVGGHLGVLGVAVWGEAVEYLEVPVSSGTADSGLLA